VKKEKAVISKTIDIVTYFKHLFYNSDVQYMRPEEGPSDVRRMTVRNQFSFFLKRIFIL
jgi:hypothetical protein